MTSRPTVQPISITSPHSIERLSQPMEPILVEVRLYLEATLETSQLRELLHKSSTPSRYGLQSLRSFFSDRALRCEDHELTMDDLGIDLADHIHSIRIACSGRLFSQPLTRSIATLPDGVSDGRLRRFWWEVCPEIFPYKLHEGGPSEEHQDEEACAFCREWSLPTLEFRDLWEHLHFDDDLKPTLLRYVETALLFSHRGVHQDAINWNRLVLLHGPPGTGKTSLCKALAQKVAVRLYTRYKRGIRLMEVNAHSLFSKWFSESGKLVTKLFEKIQDLLRVPDVLLFVLIDEVESLTSARKSAVCGSEPSDALRAVNALLTQLDRLQHYPNVVVMTTSNVTEAIDEAFLDRADVKRFVGPPALSVRYRILHRSLQELQRVGCIDGFDASKDESCTTEMALRCSLKLSQSTLGPQELLRQCAGSAEGFSCRTMKKLPFLAYTNCPGTPPLPCLTFLEALHGAIRLECNNRKDLPSSNN